MINSVDRKIFSQNSTLFMINTLNKIGTEGTSS